jgi:hypothetical protein
MTDRIGALTVILDTNYRDDDVPVIVDAIKMIRGVAVVRPHVSDSLEQSVGYERAQGEIHEVLLKVLRAIRHGNAVEVVEKPKER